MSWPRKPGPARPKPEPPKKSPRKALPDELAHDAVAHEKPAPESKYLLTGLLRCQHCGGGLHVSRQSGRRGQGLWLYYVYARQRTRGIPCPGALRVGGAVVEAAVLEDLGAKLMAPERIAAAVRRAAARLTAKPDSGRGRRSRLTRELRALDQELGRYAEAIATAGPLPSLLDALQGRERRRAVLAGELGQMDALARMAAVVDDVAVTAELRALCAEWRALLAEDPPVAQQIVGRMLTERLSVERTAQGVRVTGMATFGPLVASIVMRGEMVPPEGLALQWRGALPVQLRGQSAAGAVA